MRIAAARAVHDDVNRANDAADEAHPLFKARPDRRVVVIYSRRVAGIKFAVVASPQNAVCTAVLKCILEYDTLAERCGLILARPTQFCDRSRIRIADRTEYRRGGLAPR